MKAICVLTNIENKKIKGHIEFEIVKKNKKKYDENINKH